MTAGPASTGADALAITDAGSAATAARMVPSRLLKVQSWLGLHRVSVDALPGVVVLRWSKAAQAIVQDFADRAGFTELLFRSEATDRRPDAARGGYLVPLDDVGKESRQAIDDDRLPFWLEPVSRYDDFYSANALLWRNSQDVVVEVVGPGFDASDLNRGDVVPHETVEFSLWDDVGRYPTRQLISADAYAASVRERWIKVSSQLGAQGDNEPQLARLRLASQGYELLARHESAYPPIPDKLLRHLHRSLVRVVADFPSLGLPGAPLVLSCSFVGAKQRPVYWDVVSPGAKYDLQAPNSHLVGP